MYELIYGIQNGLHSHCDLPTRSRKRSRRQRLSGPSGGLQSHPPAQPQDQGTGRTARTSALTAISSESTVASSKPKATRSRRYRQHAGQYGPLVRIRLQRFPSIEKLSSIRGGKNGLPARTVPQVGSVTKTTKLPRDSLRCWLAREMTFEELPLSIST